MKGLLIKDLKLMKVQSRFILIVVIIVAAMAIYGTQNFSFLIMYVTLVGCIISIGSITYDEMDNGNVFLFSLPVSRQGYVTEKYVFSLIMCVGAWLIGTGAAAAGGLIKSTGTFTDSIMMALPYLPVMLFLLAFMLPFRLLFGSEKGRIVYMVILGGGLVVTALAEKLIDAMHIDTNPLTELAERIEAMDVRVLAAGGAALAAAAFLISLAASIVIMKKKEF